ncbi:hypothetical protein [Endozoicomonas sp.]|uniref:hypothetical protein n=1 Tax=Endozoicomonas sp. TaxID=1892382 RepID=UPI00383A0F1D
MTEILEKQKYLTPISVFVTIGLLSNGNVVRWKNGSIPYLERVIICNLSKASRILRLIRFHCHDLNMTPSISVYKGKKRFLRFSKTGEKNLEEGRSLFQIFCIQQKTVLTNQGRCRIAKQLTDTLPLLNNLASLGIVLK